MTDYDKENKDFLIKIGQVEPIKSTTKKDEE